MTKTLEWPLVDWPSLRLATVEFQRLRSCWDACSGISDADLQALAGTSILEKANASFDAVQKQRDDLLAALKSISDTTGDAGFNIGGPMEYCPEEIDLEGAKALLALSCEYLKSISKVASSAIASAKPAAPAKTCPPCHGDCNQGRECPARTGGGK